MMTDFKESFEDFVTNLFIEDLKEHILLHSNPDTDPFETVDNKIKLINGLLTTLKYYAKPSEYQAFVEKLNELD